MGVPDGRRLPRWGGVGLRALLVALACGFGVWVEWPFLRAYPVTNATHIVVAVGFVLTGVLLGAESGQRPNGRLFIAVGLLWLTTDINSRGIGPLPALSLVVRPLGALVLMVILLRYPATRIRDRLTRTVAVAGWLAVLVPYYVGNFLWDPFSEGWRRTFWWPTILARNSLSHNIMWGYAVSGVLLPAAVVVLIVRRYRRSRGLTRREMRPVLVSAGAVALAYVVTQLVQLVNHLHDIGPVLGTAQNLVLLTVPVSFAAAALRRRLDRTAVADLVLNVPQPATVLAVRDALRHALLDRTLDVYVWLPDRGHYTDGVVSVPEVAVDGRLCRDLRDTRGERLAVVRTDTSLDRRADLLDSAVRAAALSLENARLHAALLDQLQQLAQSRTRIVEAGLAERRRVERDLHDGAQQRLLALAATIGRARTAAHDSSLQTLMDQARGELRAALKDLRDLARGIHPAVLEQVGLSAAVETVAEALPVPVQIDIGTARLPPAVESTAYFVICEALTNIVKHAGARRATVDLKLRNSTVQLTVWDDGRGGAALAPGGGLAGLTDRVAALGGQLHLDSPPSAGTRLTVELPSDRP